MKNIIPTPLETIIYWPSFFAEIILRKNFGQNYLTHQSKKHLLIIFLVPIGDYFEPLISPLSKSIIWFLIICAVRALFELARATVNQRKKLKIHSYSSGDSFSIWKLLTKNNSLVRSILEPTLVGLIAIAFIATKFDVLSGYFLTICTFSLFSKEQFYIRRTQTITTAKKDATGKQEAITDGDLMTDYDNEQIGNVIPKVDEISESVMDGMKNGFGWKG